VTREAFHIRLTQLQERLQELGMAAETAVRKAVDSLEEQNLQEAKEFLQATTALISSKTK
jgi:hypothetical protein